MERGNISIHTENIFPIIKKWLYSDKDIFVRELISNGCDAVHKLKRLTSLGEAKVEEDNAYKIVVKVNKDKKTLSFSDNGIGMTAEEVEKYITQVAFSGAEDFVKQYKESEDEGKQIIGHFGLGFYSAFMVSDKVQIDTLSYKEGVKAVKWICDGGTEYEIGDSNEQKSRGTTITLYINEESSEFLDNYKVRAVIEKYCSFMPVEIFFEDECAEKKEDEKELPVNETKPLWTKMPKDCSDEEYKEFYKKEFKDYNDPLFWIHLNVDYPFNLKGILYFPKLKHELEVTEGEVKLYNNQVYVADNIKEVIPEFLLLLKGVIDCPDLPLNVSRSFLQQDKNVIKISKHIVKKVADKLVNVFTNQRENYESFWDDIQIFIKYGCLRDESFYEKIKEILIFKDLNGKYVTLKEYIDESKETHENKIYYVNNENEQSQYINIFKENNLNAVILNCSIDNHFITLLERENPNLSFLRIDSDINDILKNTEDSDNDTAEEIKGLFKEILKGKIEDIKVEALKNEEITALITVSEQSRRMIEMSRMYGNMDMAAMFKEEKTLVLNKNNKIVNNILKLENEEGKNLICNEIFDLARISSGGLSPEEITEFIKRSNKLIENNMNID